MGDIVRIVIGVFLILYFVYNLGRHRGHKETKAGCIEILEQWWADMRDG